MTFKVFAAASFFQSLHHWYCCCYGRIINCPSVSPTASKRMVNGCKTKIQQPCCKWKNGVSFYLTQGQSWAVLYYWIVASSKNMTIQVTSQWSTHKIRPWEIQLMGWTLQALVSNMALPMCFISPISENRPIANTLKNGTILSKTSYYGRRIYKFPWNKPELCLFCAISVLHITRHLVF